MGHLFQTLPKEDLFIFCVCDLDERHRRSFWRGSVLEHIAHVRAEAHGVQHRKQVQKRNVGLVREPRLDGNRIFYKSINKCKRFFGTKNIVTRKRLFGTEDRSWFTFIHITVSIPDVL